jgi:hypothetical protein
LCSAIKINRKMTEDFLHYLWINQLFTKQKFSTTSGEAIEVIHPGVANSDAGPDFFNAKIRIGKTIWVGNVEIHVRSSDWLRHNHQSDKAYDNVILHAVSSADTILKRSSGEEIPTVELLYDKRLYDNYLKLISGNEWIPCQDKIGELEPLFIHNWLDRLAAERLEVKSEVILNKLDKNLNDWEETFYQMIGRSFGFRLNSSPFELLTQSVSLKHLLKHSDSLFHIEAILFGQSGFLSGADGDEHYMRLKRDYDFFRSKFSLQPVENHLWKFLRLRPSNFPTVRIAQFSALIFKHKTLFSKIIESNSFESIRDLLDVRPSEYWNSHYQFNRKSLIKEKKLGIQAIDSLIINAVIPVIFTYGSTVKGSSYKEYALELLQSLPAEVNSIITAWKRNKIPASNAMESQALLQLKNVYCDKKRCLHCSIGNKILLKSII